MVADALKDATQSLQDALNESSSSVKCDNGGKEVAAAPSPQRLQQQDTDDEMDPDDLAAAFFAKEAKAPSLPVDEWAQLITRQHEKRGVIMEDTREKKNTVSQQQQVDALYQDFQQAIAEE